MKNMLRKASGALNETIDMSKDAVLNIPRIEMIGDTQLTVESHKGISSFSDNEVVVKTKIGDICMFGDDFTIGYITDNTIIIEGKFKTVDIRGNKDGK